MAHSHPIPPHSVAIVGMSGRFPGAQDVAALWRNLVERRCATTDFSQAELDFSQAVLDPDKNAVYIRARPVLDGVELFDAPFFGILPRQAELMDPQHRVFLECAWEALESSGYDSESFPGLIGLYAGASLNTYLLYNLASETNGGENVAVSYPLGNPDILFGNDKDFLTTRVAYKLNLRGPCVAVQTACSTSLVAVCHAYYSLLTYQCDMALAGGVSITFPQKRDYLYQAGGMVSRDGRCRTFDAEADGTVFGSGAGVVVLKRLEDAIADGDVIHAVIRGVAMNNDGADRIGYSAPGVNGQADVISMALAAAGVGPETVSYIEAHGTGTPLGDPIEVAALTQAFRKATQARQFCGIGSVKTNVGHLDMAAGVTGLIKTVLQLEHRTIPPLLHFTAPNSKIDFENSPFYPVAELTGWKRGAAPRRAGVSAFGVGGTNAHVIVEEAPDLDQSGPSRPEQLLLLSARTEAALDTMAANLASHLESHPDLNLADVAYTLQRGRRPFSQRRAIVAATASNAAAALRAPGAKAVFSGQDRQREPRVVFLFPGQGAQYVDMGRELYETETVFRAEVDRCSTILQTPLGTDIRSVLFPTNDRLDAARQQIGETSITQPAIFVIEYALARLWMSWGVNPSVLIGHSVGEYVCATLAGTLRLEDALALLSARARLMQGLPPGSMLAVRMPVAELESVLPADASLAALNSPMVCTVSGPTRVLETFQKELGRRQIETRFLQTSHAFHSAMMEPMLPEFLAAANNTERKPSHIPWISTCTGGWMTAEDVEDAAYWCRQVRHTVRFATALSTLFEDYPDSVLLEVGPGQTLSQLARQHPAKPADLLVLGTLGPAPEAGRDVASMLSTLGRLWTVGLKPDWNGFYANERRRRVQLPTYPFERKRFWVEPARTMRTAPAEPTTEASPQDQVSQMIASNTSSERRGRLARELRATIQELSGIEVSDETASFTELGFDSLFLTQASRALQTKYGVTITFRQMLDELSSVGALLEYLDKNLPAEAVAPSQPAGPAQAAEPPRLSESGRSAIEQLIEQQRQLMQLLLSQQRGETALPGLSSGALERGVKSPASSSLTVVKWPGAKPLVSTATGTNQEFKRFGPYKPVEKGEKGGLTSRQQEALDGLIARYVRRTGKSKAYTAEHRPHFADPRAVSGFQSNWKEMVYPIVAEQSKGSRIWDLDGNEYVDITMGFGAYFFGHSPDWLVRVLEEQLRTGIEIGPQNPLAGKAARLICEFTGMERAAFCNTGSEAVMAAVRVARTVTGRKRVVYFTGDYHGMFEEVLVRGTWVNGEYRAQPIAPGIPSSLVENILVLEYGAPESLDIIKAHADDIAAVIVEPVQSRHPTLQPKQFLADLRSLTARTGIALVFDEVVTGFRCHPGGAQAYFGVRADLATYGKVIGGGVPIGVVAGTRKYMDALDGGMWNFGDDSFPEVGVTFFAGTFVRHPLAMAAACAVLERFKTDGPALQLLLTERVSRLTRTLNDHCEKIEVPVRFPSFSAVAMIEHAHDIKYASLLWYYLRDKGIHVWEGRPCVFTLAHTDADLNQFVRAFKDSVSEMQDAGFLPESPAGTERLGVSWATEFPQLDSAPLTEAQRELFYSAAMSDEANCAFNESFILYLEGPVDVAALRRSLCHLIERHPALRSRFSRDGETQHFLQSFVPEIPLHDWTDLEPAEREDKFNRLAAVEMATPFDMFAGPLVRLQLVRSSDADFRLVYNAHHLVCDGWSIGMLVAELVEIYNALTAERIPLLAPPMSFGDYARLQYRLKSESSYSQAEQFWLDQFADSAPTLELPTDRPRPALKSFKGAMERRVVAPERFARLKKVTPQLGGTVFATLLSTFATLLHRLGGQQDLVIGVPAAGQAIVGCNELVGHCLNFLPMRLRFSKDTPFAEFAKSVKKSVLDAYEHQNYTYGTLVQKLTLPRDTSRLPLVSVMFNIDKSGFDHLKFNGLTFRVSTNPKRFVNFDIFFNLVQDETSLNVECEYNTDLFDRDTILRWLETFEVLIEGVIVAGQSKLCELPLLGDAERRKMLVQWNDTARAYPRDMTIHGLFEEQAKLTPAKTAVVCGGTSLTYAELNQVANTLAAHLRSSGVNAGSLVGLCIERSVEMVIGMLGILKAGAGYVPMDPAFPAERLGTMVQDARMPVIVTRSSLESELRSLNAATLALDTVLEESPSDFDSSTAGAGDLAYVIFTSGSTGRPKGVEISHQAVVNFLNSMRREPGLTPDDILVAVTTLSFDIAGLELFLPLTTGATVVVATREMVSDGHLLSRELGRVNATAMQATPSTWQLLLEAGWKGSPRLKSLVGGDAVPQELVNQLVARCASVWNVYGPTETTIWSTTGRVFSGKGPVSIGRPIDNTQVYIVNAALQPQPVGIPGELLIGGDGVARGYHGRAELTADRFIADPFRGLPGARIYRTGDLAKWRPDGSIECLGRMDNQVKVRGFRIELGDVEAALGRHPGVKQTVVVAWEDVPGRKRLVAYFVPALSPAPTAGDLREHLWMHLPDYMVPTIFVSMGALPLTPNGKVDRKALPSPDDVAAPPPKGVTPPRTPSEQTLAGIWKAVLRRELISVDDDIFDLGGDSILVFQITARANRMGLALTPSQLFQYRTIETLGRFIDSAGAFASPPASLAAPIARVDREKFSKRVM